ncbi:MAG: DUF116 domain-containing protein [Nanoarchaeota archaeon]|nr:DUF116 domain-containing protein [Nanoarchaeota archaeon]
MRKVLFLPKCLIQEQVDEIKSKAEKKGYEVYVVPGASKVKKILDGYEAEGDIIDKLIGVACELELSLSEKYLPKYGVLENAKISKVMLLKDGCEDTYTDLEKFLEIL